MILDLSLAPNGIDELLAVRAGEGLRLHLDIDLPDPDEDVIGDPMHKGDHGLPIEIRRALPDTVKSGMKDVIGAAAEARDDGGLTCPGLMPLQEKHPRDADERKIEKCDEGIHEVFWIED